MIPKEEYPDSQGTNGDHGCGHDGSISGNGDGGESLDYGNGDCFGYDSGDGWFRGIDYDSP